MYMCKLVWKEGSGTEQSVLVDWDKGITLFSHLIRRKDVEYICATKVAWRSNESTHSS